MTHEAPDVAIVGAGPTGLMAATLLRRWGVRVRIFDKTAQQAHESRAFAVHARSMELLGSIGLAERFLDRGLVTLGFQVFVDGKRVAAVDFDDLGRTDTPYPFVLMVPQSEIESILADDLADQGVTVEHGVEVTGFTQSDDGVEVHLRPEQGPPSALRAAYLIGADGAHSIVRKTLGLTFDGAPYPQGFLLADCRVDWPLDHHHLKIFVSGRDLAVFLPLRGSDVSRIIAIVPQERGIDPFAAPTTAAALETAGSEPATLDEVQQAFRGTSRQPVTLHDPRWVTRYRIHHRGVNRYGVGRVFIAGDAAHIHSPAGGQGMNTGLQDATNLAWKLAAVLRSGASPALLDSYHAERWPVGQKVLETTDRLFAGMSAQGPWATAIRNRVIPFVAPLVARVAPARRRAFRFASQLGIRYRPGPFVQDVAAPGAPRAWRHGPAAGHRAPNATIAPGRDVFGLIGGYRFHLLALSHRALTEGEIATIHSELAALHPPLAALDVESHLVARSLIGRDPRLLQAESPEVFAVYGLGRRVPQALFLVRPDGYLAYRAADLDVATVRAFIQRFSASASVRPQGTRTT
jgi:2-polyprenyl-6-methoxyphenol hydroxylase-like FAD-dependent oxidoreductase